jgi:hypothetical protein
MMAPTPSLCDLPRCCGALMSRLPPVQPCFPLGFRPRSAPPQVGDRRANTVQRRHVSMQCHGPNMDADGKNQAHESDDLHTCRSLASSRRSSRAPFFVPSLSASQSNHSIRRQSPWTPGGCMPCSSGVYPPRFAAAASLPARRLDLGRSISDCASLRCLLGED